MSDSPGTKNQFSCLVLFHRSDEEGQQASKKELIDTAKLIAINSQNVVKLARQVADECPDKRLKQVNKVFLLINFCLLSFVMFVIICHSPLKSSPYGQRGYTFFYKKLAYKKLVLRWPKF